jgi:hypothetical protein
VKKENKVSSHETGNFLKFNDLVQFSMLNPSLVKVKDDYEMMTQQGISGQAGQQNAKGLAVSIAATHSGIITRNNGFYMPDKMKAGAQTFTDDFGKPILLHHNDKEDSVGRVYSAEYIDTSGSIIDKYNGLVVRNSMGNEIGTIKEELIKDFVSDRMPFGQQIDVVCSLLKDSVLEDATYAGLGHIQLVANITDKTAIEKLLDGRYLTGSVGATTNKAVCSVCKSDWTKGGPCDHKPGGIYDSSKCFIIAGKLIYDEYSFVNVPADRHSKVLELHYNGITDNIEIANDYKGRIYEVRLEFPQYDSANKEDNGMTVKKDGTPIQDSTNDPAPVAELTDKGTEDTVVQDNIETPTETPKTEETEVVVQDEVKPDAETPESTKESVQDFVVRVLGADSEPTDEDRTRAYDMLWTEASSALEAGLFDNLKDTFTDLKLSDAKRQSLVVSQFCTPKRMFPVNDVAHIVAAYRLLNCLELNDETKKELLSTINRKARVQGLKLNDDFLASGKTEDGYHHGRLMQVILQAFEENRWGPEDDPALSDDDKKSLSDILKRLASLVGKDNFVAAATGQDLTVSDNALLGEVAKLEETICDLQDSLSATRKEYTNLYQDLETLQDSLVEEKSKTRKVKENYTSTLRTLNDAKISEENTFSELTDESLSSELTRLTKEVDMIKITDKLGDGMSRTPDGESLEDPTVVLDTQTPKSTQISLEDLTNIQQHYYHLLFSEGQIRADAYAEQLHLEGRLPNGIEDIKGGSN